MKTIHFTRPRAFARTFFLSGLASMLAFSPSLTATAINTPTIVPQPVNTEFAEGSFTLRTKFTIAVPHDSVRTSTQVFVRLMSAAQYAPTVKAGRRGDIVLSLNKAMKPEAYQLSVTPKCIRIEAASCRGFFYGLQSLRLLLPSEAESIEGKSACPTWSVPALRITDEPRFEYRGFMLDVARYFMPKEDLKRMIDCISMLKINKLHLHLSDDNGWRIEIKRYPLLTQTGAWRVDRPGQYFPARRNPKAGEPTPVGGFYTQDDIREIIAFAQERQVDVIPEIDIPAHSNAALAAYPEYACPTVKEFIGVLPGLGGRNAEIIFCAGNEKTFGFLQNIIDEIVDLFPSHYIHLGGDEATKTHWKKCPLCQARIRSEQLKDEEELQGYFMGRMSDYVRGKGREVMGWDELTNSRLPQDAVIFGWQGMGNAALKAAAQGHRFVLTPAKVAYLIRYQGPQWFEPTTYFGNNTLKGLYQYEPVQKEWPASYEPLLMGVQGSMWTEFCATSDDVFYLVFPRLAALAEVGWSPKGSKDWNSFAGRLDSYVSRLEQKGVTSARSMFNIQHTVLPDAAHRLQVTLECERPDVEIRYTTDGSDPSAQSALYHTPLQLTADATIKAATFRNGQQMGKTLSLPIVWNLATAKTLIGRQPKEAAVMLNGVRGSLKQTDFEWYTEAPRDTIRYTIDLQKTQSVKSFAAGSVTNYGMAVHKPRSMEVSVSDDNVSFTSIGRIAFTDPEIFKEGNFKDELRIDAPQAVSARYVRFTFGSAGPCPTDHVRPGQPSRIYLDELSVK